ncbi:hypothetical protein ACWFRQ_29020 [Streptomyces niveus]
MRELARDLDVSHAAPSRHFKDRQALLDALALVGYERMTAVMLASQEDVGSRAASGWRRWSARTWASASTTPNCWT